MDLIVHCLRKTEHCSSSKCFWEASTSFEHRKALIVDMQNFIVAVILSMMKFIKVGPQLWELR